MITCIEVCIDSVASARNAAEVASPVLQKQQLKSSSCAQAGCERVELCAGLVEGGTTPSAGMIQRVRQELLRVHQGATKLMVLVRPRGGDFCYSEEEIAVMLHDIALCKTLGADGVVVGALSPDGTVDVPTTTRLVQAALPMLVTFHRAFDMVKDAAAELETVIGIHGIQRILSSGLDKTALEGSGTLAQLVKQAEGRIIIVAGGGISVRNVERIVRETNVREVHMSARTAIESPMVYRNSSVSMGQTFGPPEYRTSVASASILLDCRRILS